jgi:hypothetical protein
MPRYSYIVSAVVVTRVPYTCLSHLNHILLSTLGFLDAFVYFLQIISCLQVHQTQEGSFVQSGSRNDSKRKVRPITSPEEPEGG